MTRLVRLYPRWWRDRYADEFADLVTTLRAERGRLGRLRLAADVARGAIDARLQRRPDMTDPALRRGALAGVAIATVMIVVLVLSNVVFPAGPNDSDNDPEYLIQLGAGYLLLLVLFLLIGGYAGRWAGSAADGAKGGAAAALVIVLVVFVTTTIIDNVFLDVVSRQHDKRMAFAASGQSSMRTFLNLQMLVGLVTITPFATGLGAGLGALGGRFAKFRTVL